jgi:hypothetical protein
MFLPSSLNEYCRRKRGLRRQLPPQADPVRYGRLIGHLGALACLQESGRFRQARAAARDLEVLAERWLLRNARQGRRDLLLFFCRRRADVQHIHFDRRLLRPNAGAHQEKELGQER